MRGAFVIAAAHAALAEIVKRLSPRIAIGRGQGLFSNAIDHPLEHAAPGHVAKISLLQKRSREHSALRQKMQSVMSPLGQERTLGRPMDVLLYPLKADIDR